MGMKYVPMTAEEWAKFLGDDYPNGLHYGFYGHIEKAVLARIEAQGLVIVPKADAERVALIERIDAHINTDYIPMQSVDDLLAAVRAYLQGGA
jgi:hypothetical protein